MSDQWQPFRGCGRGGRGGRRGGGDRGRGGHFRHPCEEGSTDPPFQDPRGLPPRNAYHTSSLHSLNSLDGSGRGRPNNSGGHRGNTRGSGGGGTPNNSNPHQNEGGSQSRNRGSGKMSRGQSMSDLPGSKSQQKEKGFQPRDRGGNERGRCQKSRNNCTSSADLNQSQWSNMGEARGHDFGFPNMSGRPSPGDGLLPFPQGFIPRVGPRGFPRGPPGSIPRGSAGGFPRGPPGGIPRGPPGGIPRGQPGGFPRGPPGGVPRGPPGSFPRGPPGGVPRGPPGGIPREPPGPYPDTSQGGGNRPVRPKGPNLGPRGGCHPRAPVHHVPGPNFNYFPEDHFQREAPFPVGPRNAPVNMPNLAKGASVGHDAYASAQRPFSRERWSRGRKDRGNKRGSRGYKRGRSGYAVICVRKQDDDSQEADSDDSYATNVSSIHPEEDAMEEVNVSTPRDNRSEIYCRGFRGRQRYRRGRWSRYTKRYNKTLHHSQYIDNEDDNQSQCETASVRSSSPMSVVSDVQENVNDKTTSKNQISSDDIKNVGALTLNNRIKRYQRKIVTLECQDNVDDGQIKYIKQVIADIKEELAIRRCVARNKEKEKTKENTKTETEELDQTEENVDSESDENHPVTQPSKPLVHTRKSQAKVAVKKGGVVFRPSAKTKTNQVKEAKKTSVREEKVEKKMEKQSSESAINENMSDENAKNQTHPDVAVSDKSVRKKNKPKNKKATVKEERDEDNTAVEEIENLLSGLDAMFVKEKQFKSPDDNRQAASKSNKKCSSTDDADIKVDTPTASKGTEGEKGHGKTSKMSCKTNASAVDDTTDAGTSKSRDRRDSGSQLNEPNVNDVFKFMVKEMEGKGKPVVVSSKSGLFPQHFDSEKLQRWFQNNSGRYTLIKRCGKLSYVLVFKKDCKFCLDYTSGRGCVKSETCKFYHICKDFLFGYCRYGWKKCRFSHDLLDEYNIKLSKEMGYNKVFNTTEICAVLRARYPHACPSWNKEDCYDVNCAKLHICQRYLLDDCLEGSECVYGHDRFTDHNKPIVDAYVMGHWNDKMFRKMVIIERKPPQEVILPDTVEQLAARPKVTCTQSSRANRVFVVRPDSGTDVDAVTRSEDADHKEYKTEQKAATEVSVREKKVSVEPAHIRRTKQKKDAGLETVHISNSEVGKDAGLEPGSIKEAETSISSEVIHDDTVICDLGLAGKCDGSKCGLYHNRSLNLPYIWQVNMFGTWVSLAQAEDVEIAFCAGRQESGEILVRSRGLTGSVVLNFNDPHIHGFIRFGKIDGYEQTQARRISTSSYTEKESAADSFVTQWRWHWKDDYGQWKLFDEDTMQYTLETKYLAGQKEYLFTRENYRFKYIIDFHTMQQRNLDTGKYRELIRRPQLVNARDVRHGKTAPKLRPFPPIEVPRPEDWVPWDHTNDFEMVKLSSDSKTYKDTVSQFFRTMSKHSVEVDCVYRVQSHSQWDAFSRKERDMKTTLERTSPGAVLDKRDLFHGTDNLDTVRGICTQNFDPRVSGKNATAYGDGAYFARDAKYSHNYTKPPERFVFLAHVLVGQYAAGKSEYRRPPLLPGSKLVLYDSCVNHLTNPSIFILFDKSQHYPAYLIQYKDSPQDVEDLRQMQYPGSQPYKTYPGSSVTTGASSYPTAYPSHGPTTYPPHSTPSPTSRYPSSSSTSPSPPSRAPKTSPKKDTSCSIQ